MRKFLLLTILFSSIIYGQSSKWVKFASLNYKWSKNLPDYKFILEVPEQWSDPGDFIRLRIIPPNNGHEFAVVDSGGFIKISDALENNKLIKRNLLKSDYLYFCQDLLNSDNDPALILFCPSYASTPGVIHIIQLNKDNYPVEVFSKEFQITDFDDVDGNGIKELVGLPAFAEEWGRCFESYNPYRVYKYSENDNKPLTYSLSLSEKYNKLHYYGWMGPDFSEKIVVVHCVPNAKKPVIMKLEDAEKLFK